MKRLMVIALVSALVIPLSSASARSGAPPQKEEGTILIAAPGPNGETTGGCWTGWERRFWIVSGGSTSGVFGSMIAIDKTTWEGQFKLDVTSGAAGTEDLDITFYRDPGHVDPNDPAQQSGIVASGAYLTRAAGGEDGMVPKTSEWALVCLGIGSGANAGWSYEGLPPTKKKKKR